MDHQEHSAATFFQTALQVGIVLSVFNFAIGIGNLYLTINGAISGMMLSFSSAIAGLLSCLVMAAGGLFAVKIYLKDKENKQLKLGQGALIGLFTGIVASIFGLVLGEMWSLIDSEMYVRFIDAAIDSFEDMPGMTDELIDQMEDQYAGLLTIGGRLKQSLIGLPIMAIFSSLSGMLGVKLFAEKIEDL